MRLAAVLALCCLAGCGFKTLPGEVLEAGPRTDHSLTMDPQRAAGCISRNAEGMVDTIRAPVTALPSKDSYEIVMRVRAGDYEPVLMVAHVTSTPPGSRVAMHGTGYTIRPPRDEFVASLIKGC